MKNTMTAQAETDLRHLLLENTTGVILAVDAKMRLLYTNPQAQQLLGYSANDLQHAFLPDLVYPDARIWVKKTMDAVLASKRPANIDLHLRSQSGSNCTLSGILSIWKQASGEDGLAFYGVEYSLVVNDNPSLAHLLNNLPGFAYRALNDEYRTMLLISEGVTALTGHSPQDLMYNQKLAFADMILPEDWVRESENTQRALKAHHPYESTYRITTAEGEIRWILDRGQGIYGSEGQIIALEGFAMDVTAQKQIAHALHESEQRLAVLIANAPMLLFMVDRERKFMFAQGAILKQWSLDPGDLIGRSVPKFYRDFPVILDALEAALQGHTRLFTVEIETFTFLAIASPFYDEQEQLMGVIGAAIDISPQQQAENALRQAIHQLTMLYEGTRVLIAAPTAKELLKVFAGHMVEKEGCHATLLYAHNDDQGLPQRLELACLLTPEVPKMFVPTGPVNFEIQAFPLWQDLVTPSYKIIEAADIDADNPFLSEGHRARLKGFGVGAFAAIPLKLHDRW
jgi:PAS domain S-box-containing protein